MKRNRIIKKYKYQKKRRYKNSVKTNNRLKSFLLMLILGLTSYAFLTISIMKIIPYDKLANFYLNDNSIKFIENYCADRDMDPFPYIAYYLDSSKYDARLFSEKEVSKFMSNIKWYNRININKRYNKVAKIIEKAISDIKCFPVEASESEYTFEDTYGATRTYGGNRVHLGTDIMDIENIRGRLEIVSMTDGTIANLGWNEKGGWRIGINSPSGTYFYYAHLDSYNKGIYEGMEIKAGDTLGFMGDSGYGKEPGTIGKFPVHLHIGIMLRDVTEDEFWINPFYILKYSKQINSETTMMQ